MFMIQHCIKKPNEMQIKQKILILAYNASLCTAYHTLRKIGDIWMYIKLKCCYNFFNDFFAVCRKIWANGPKNSLVYAGGPCNR